MNVHVHPAKVIYIVEGNVFEVIVDLDFYIHIRDRVRLEGLDLPNMRSGVKTDRVMARGAKDCAMKFLLNRDVLIETFQGNTNHVRWTANIYIPWEPTEYERSRVSIAGVEYIDVCKYMRCLGDVGYDPEKVDLPRLAGVKVG